MEWASMKRHFILSFGVGLAICVLVVAGAWGQAGTTSVQGVVTDKSGAAITGAHVTLTSTEEGAQERTIATEAAGEFEFLALQPGTYTLTVDSPGFRKYDRKSLQLLVNTPVTVNVTMEVGSSSQTVEVSAQAETLNTTDASLGTAFSTKTR